MTQCFRRRGQTAHALTHKLTHTHQKVPKLNYSYWTLRSFHERSEFISGYLHRDLTSNSHFVAFRRRRLCLLCCNFFPPHVYNCLFSICAPFYRPLPPDGNPTAVNRYHLISSLLHRAFRKITSAINQHQHPQRNQKHSKNPPT